MGDPTRPNVEVTTRGVTTVVPGVNVREGRSVGLRSPEDRQVNGAASGNSQRTMGFGTGNTSMTNANTHRYIQYTPRPTNVVQNMDQAEIRALNNDTGTVDIKAYTEWLSNNGYKLR